MMPQVAVQKVCLYCAEPLPKGRRKYCSARCSILYGQENLYPLRWGNAVATALRRTGGCCEECGSSERLEVHHLVHLAQGERRHNSPKNVQSNLIVFCRQHHTQVHHPPKSYWVPEVWKRIGRASEGWQLPLTLAWSQQKL